MKRKTAFYTPFVQPAGSPPSISGLDGELGRVSPQLPIREVHMFVRHALLLLVALLTFASEAAAAPAKKTHLGVPPRQVVNIETFQLPNDNSGGHEFFYDRTGATAFSVPPDRSFVVTDIVVCPV